MPIYTAVESGLVAFFDDCNADRHVVGLTIVVVAKYFNRKSEWSDCIFGFHVSTASASVFHGLPPLCLFGIGYL